MKYLSFENGDQMPVIGLGTWKSEPGEVYEAVKAAIKAGYRHIDCAPIYGNEKEVGKALKEMMDAGEVKREDLWITSKLWNNAHHFKSVKPALEKTLNDLQLDYLDLFLIHWPVAMKPEVDFPKKGTDFLSLTEAPLLDTWKGMEEVKTLGMSKHIGVSNFNTHHLDHLIQNAGIKPEMNQCEYHPHLVQDELTSFCHKHDVHFTAYSPLGSMDRAEMMKQENEPILIKNEEVEALANAHDVSPAQILLAWGIAKGVAVIPKSVNPKRMKENLGAIEVKLSDEDVKKLDALNKNFRYVDGSFWTMKGSPYSMQDLWG